LIPPPTISTLEQLAGKLGEWPILLKLVNAQLREEYHEGLSPSEAFRIVEDALGKLGLTAFDREDEEARNLAVRRTVEASLQRLSSEDRKRYAQLAVFAEDENIPLTVLQLLWTAEKPEVAHVCRRLADMSLLYRFDRVSNWVQLHDVMRSYLLREHSVELRSFQGAFVDSYLDARETEESWQEAERYFVARLPYHLKESGRVGDLEDLLFSYSWLEKKISGTDVNTAMADYDLLAGNQDAASVREALLLSRSVLTVDLSQLASHIHGRLTSSSSLRIANLLEGAIANYARPWFRPLSASLQRPSGPLTYSFQAHQGEVRAIAQLDDNRFATTGTEGEIHVWDFATGESIAAISAAVSPIRHLATVAPNRLLAGSDDGVIRLWDLDEEQVVRTYEEHHSPITALRLRHEEFLSGAEDGTLFRWSLDSELPLGSFQGHQSKVNGLGYLDARTMVSIGKDRTLRVWNLPSRRQIKALTLPVFAAENLVVTASNEVILGTWAGEIQTWKPLSNETQPRRSFRHPAVGMDALCILEKDFGASTVGGLSEIQLWNPKTSVLGVKLHVPGGGVSALARFGAGHLLCGSKDGSLSVWAIELLRAPMTESPPGSVYSVSAVDATTAISSSDKFVKVWNVPTGALLRDLGGHSGTVSSVCTLGSERVAASSEDAIRIWNPHTGELLNTIQCSHKIGPLATFEAPGGDYLAIAPASTLAKDQPIQIWHVTLGRKMVDLPVFPGGVATLCAAPGRLFVGTYNGWVFHFDFSGAASPRHFDLRGHERGVFSLAVIDQDQIASGSLDKTIRVWNLRSQETIQVLKGHEGGVIGLVSISSRFLVSASEDQTIKLWDLETGTPIVSLRLDAGLSSLAIMPDGKTLVAGDTAGTVHFLRLEALAA
jgi:WD40 repeat protein